MSKFYGLVGFTISEETAKDVWEPIEKSRYYTGDMIRNQRRWANGESVNENLDISNEISLVMDNFMQDHMGALKWVEIGSTKWKVNSITLNYPRVQITLGGVYNGG